MSIRPSLYIAAINLRTLADTAERLANQAHHNALAARAKADCAETAFFQSQFVDCFKLKPLQEGSI